MTITENLNVLREEAQKKVGALHLNTSILYYKNTLIKWEI